jgi:diacylglycerol kinase (ATP)
VTEPGPLLVLAPAYARGGTDDGALDAAVRVLAAETDVVTVRTGSTDELADALAARGSRRPVVAGGDGSLHRAVRALHRAGGLGRTALGLLPLGTGNDLARGLGIPLDPAAAARVVLHGRVRPRDLLEGECGDVVVNAVHLGVGAEAARAATTWKGRLGPGAYRLGGLAAGLRSPGWRLRVEADDHVLVDTDRRTLMVGLAVGRTVGGGAAPLAPDADPEDGLADVVVSTATGPLARLAFAVRLGQGRHEDRADVLTCRASVVRVTGEAFPTNTDGELGGPCSTRTWWARPRAWWLTVPAAGDRTPDVLRSAST